MAEVTATRLSKQKHMCSLLWIIRWKQGQESKVPTCVALAYSTQCLQGQQVASVKGEEVIALLAKLRQTRGPGVGVTHLHFLQVTLSHMDFEGGCQKPPSCPSVLPVSGLLPPSPRLCSILEKCRNVLQLLTSTSNWTVAFVFQILGKGSICKTKYPSSHYRQQHQS